MIRLLSKLFIKDNGDYLSPKARKAYGFLCGGVGIGLNLILFFFKLLAGYASSSIAVMADALNNLSDAGSSGVTLIGFKIAGQKPDSDHPFGHGRMEYISGFIVSILILLMGFQIGKSSIKKIFYPTSVELDIISIVILVSSVLIKFYMYSYNKKYSKLLDSSAMKATAIDSLGDMVATTIVFASLVITKTTGLILDGYFGLGVSIFIIFSGIKAAKDTLKPILGQAPKKEFVEKVYLIALSCDHVSGIHDLIVHDYGPNSRMISFHVELDATLDVLSAHTLIDEIEQEIIKQLGCEAVVHVDPVETEDLERDIVGAKINEIIKDIDERISMHDFRITRLSDRTNVIFDLVVPFDLKTPDSLIRAQVSSSVSALNPEYFAVIKIDKENIPLEKDNKNE